LSPTGGHEGVAPSGKAASYRSGDPAQRPPVIDAEEAKESSQRADIVLEACSISPCAGLGDIRFDIAGPNGSHGNAGSFQVLEKTFRGPAMAGNGGGSESAKFAEVIRILAA
jgi:hypothetical protein